MFELNQLIPESAGFEFTEAFIVNDRGEIGGIGTPPGCDSDGTCGHALVLIAAAMTKIARASGLLKAQAL
jgi:hypothetical protein